MASFLSVPWGKMSTTGYLQIYPAFVTTLFCFTQSTVNTYPRKISQYPSGEMQTSNWRVRISLPRKGLSGALQSDVRRPAQAAAWTGLACAEALNGSYLPAQLVCVLSTAWNRALICQSLSTLSRHPLPPSTCPPVDHHSLSQTVLPKTSLRSNKPLIRRRKFIIRQKIQVHICER